MITTKELAFICFAISGCISAILGPIILMMALAKALGVDFR